MFCYLGYVDVPDLPVLGEEVLDVVDVGPGGKPINLQTDHSKQSAKLRYVFERTGVFKSMNYNSL